MNHKFKNKDLINLWIKESECYRAVDTIDQLLQEGQQLSLLPVQPLYVAIKRLPIESVANMLVNLSLEQRRVFLDLDLWEKDVLDTKSFDYWILVYSLCSHEEVKSEFVQSVEFGLYLKGSFNIWTFDVEDPNYPEHDHYFLTDDQLLLIEFDESYEYLNELKKLIQHLYYIMGVENAYSYLFKFVADSFLTMQEDEYQIKKSRLSDLGIVDYYDALEIENCFPGLSHLEQFVKTKKIVKSRLGAHQINQSLPFNGLVSFQNNLDHFSLELEKVNSQLRVDFLHFNFIRLVNATLTFNNAFKSGGLAMTRTGNLTRSYLDLGLDFVIKKMDTSKGALFDYYTFTDLYKIGKTLLHHLKKDLKKSFRKTSFDVNKSEFLGPEINSFLELAFNDIMKVAFDGKEVVVSSLELLSLVEEKSNFVKSILPFAQEFSNAVESLRREGKISNEYYLNYNINEIDFEALILTQFSNFILGHYENNQGQKMGLTLEEFKSFLALIMNKKLLKLKGLSSLEPMIHGFLKKFGMLEIIGINEYFYCILKEQFEGYDFFKMKNEDYKHVGGVILLQLLTRKKNERKG